MKKKILSGILAAVMTLSTLPAFTASAKLDMDKLPTPLSAANSSSEVKSFRSSKPKLKVTKNNYSYYYSYNYRYEALEWSKVDHALYYQVYRKGESDKDFVKVCETLYNYYYFDLDYISGEYKVRAVSYTYDDKKKYSEFSNTVTVENVAPEYYYEEYDDSEGDDDYMAADADDGYGNYDYALPEATGGVNKGVSAPTGAQTLPDGGYYIPNTEEYSHSEESGYKNPAISPLSTFSADVDTASYANLRRLINDGDSIPADAVRIEEMLNYFDYGYAKPKKNAFDITTELTDCPWNSKSQLLRIGIQGKDLETTPASNLVFLVDTSGSMGWGREEKIELVKKSINTLAKSMTSKDRISIVTYSGSENVILAGARGTQINTVSKLTSLLDVNGGTNGEGGINAAYAIAEKYFIKGGNNRIIMMTDGDLNVGISSEDELKKLIEEKRRSGVYFTVLGFGKDNIKDNKMEALADNGNGSYHYIDTAREAYKVLSAERNSTLFTIAGDVKIQVEFNPANVKSYRLIGYDNRRLENEDFTNDKKDAGEVGAGQSVTVLYEIIPADGKGSEGLKYQKNASAADTSELLTVKLRYKDTEKGEIIQRSKIVKAEDYSETMSDGMRLACAAAEFGLTLKDSDYKGTSTAKSALKLAKSIEKKDAYTKEFIKLIEKYIEDNKK